MTRKRLRLAVLGGVVLAGLGIYFFLIEAILSDLPTHEVKRSAFQITQVEGGEVQATSGEVVTSPRIGGRLKIIHLWPEGARVAVGDLLIQFDPAEFEKEMLDEEGNLERAQADYDRTKTEREQRLSELKNQLQQVQLQFDLAKLNLERSQFSPQLDQERAKIELERAERTLTDAQGNITAQEVVNRVDLNRSALEVARAQERYDRAKDAHDQTRIFAARPGIVVYRKIWKPGTDGESKVMVGDNVWGGQALLDIPDLSTMQVRCLVGEMDIKLMQVGQPASIRLDAFPGPVFQGQVAQLAPMATPQPGAPDIQVFELVISIQEQDERLKPGMSAQVEIVLQTLPEVLSVPLQAVFEQADGSRLVYCLRKGQFVPVPVELGQRNATAVEIRSGLQEGDLVALQNPELIQQP